MLGQPSIIQVRFMTSERQRAANQANAHHSTGPKTPEGRPEKSVQAVQFWTWPFPLEHGDLLSECENLEGGIATTAEEDPDGNEE